MQPEKGGRRSLRLPHPTLLRSKLSAYGPAPLALSASLIGELSNPSEDTGAYWVNC